MTSPVASPQLGTDAAAADSPTKITDYSRFLSRTAKRRIPSDIRALAGKYASQAGMLNLGGGLPAPQLFPIRRMTMEIDPPGSEPLQLEGSDLEEALQYGSSSGHPRLLAWCRDHSRRVHRPAAGDGRWETTITCGCMDGVDKVIEALANEGDTVLCEDPTYSGVIVITQPLGVALHAVHTDDGGMDPAALDRVLADWPAAVEGGPRKPRLLYLVPTGCNPTGRSLSEQRKRDLYAVAQRHDLLIIEDDPYWYLDLAADGEEQQQRHSFLSLDVDGRVIRGDSFSKIVCAGLRVGWITGPPPIVRAVMLHVMVSSEQAASLSQAVLHCLLSRWGPDGFAAHIARIRRHYRSQCDALVAAAERHLTGLADWQRPAAGMFLWLRLRNVPDALPFVVRCATAHNVLVIPGRGFSPRPDRPSPYVRATFAIAPPADLDTAMARLAQALREEKNSEATGGE